MSLFNILNYGSKQHVIGFESLKHPNANVRLSINSGANFAHNAITNDISGGVEVEPDTVVLGSIAANVAPMTPGFADGFDDEFELYMPSEGFSAISEAIEDIRNGKMVVVVYDEDRENEGDLIMAASKVTPKAMAFIVKHGTGIVCVSMKERDLERLHLPLMVNHKENEEKLRTAFTISVDAKNGTTTGVSASDRATMIITLVSKDSKPEDFNRLGAHIPTEIQRGWRSEKGRAHRGCNGSFCAGRIRTRRCTV